MIMTSSEEKKNYEKMSLSADVVESQLPAILIEGKKKKKKKILNKIDESYSIQKIKCVVFYV